MGGRRLVNRSIDQARAELARLLEIQRADYRASLAATVDRMESLWAQVQAGDDSAAADHCAAADALLRLAHTLYGTAGTYGLDAVSQSGLALENAIGACIDRSFDGASRPVVTSAIASIRRQMAQP